MPLYSRTRRDAEIYVDVARYFVVNKAIRPQSLLATHTRERAGPPSWVPKWAQWSLNVLPWIEAAVVAEREALEFTAGIEEIGMESRGGCTQTTSGGHCEVY